MRERKKLRWVVRRERQEKPWATLPFDILDITILVLIISLAIFILRISFLYATLQSPTHEIFHSFGKSFGLGSAFDLGVILSALLAAFWAIVSIIRLPKIKQSSAYMLWHLFVFVGIGLLAYGCYLATDF